MIMKMVLLYNLCQYGEELEILWFWYLFSHGLVAVRDPGVSLFGTI